MLAEVDAIAASSSVGHRVEFDEAIHCLPCGAVHDDVNGGTEGRINDFGMSAEEGEDEGFGEVIWDLCNGGYLVSAWPLWSLEKKARELKIPPGESS